MPAAKKPYHGPSTSPASRHIPSPMLVYPATVGNRTSMVVTQHSAANIALRTSIRMVSFLFFIPEYLSC